MECSMLTAFFGTNVS